MAMSAAHRSGYDARVPFHTALGAIATIPQSTVRAKVRQEKQVRSAARISQRLEFSALSAVEVEGDCDGAESDAA